MLISMVWPKTSRIVAHGLALGGLVWALSTGFFPAGAAQGAPDQEGPSLAEALEELRRQGLDLIFTNRLVSADLKVLDPPVSDDPERILEALLAPHGLTAKPGPGGRRVVVRKETGILRGIAVHKATGERLAGIHVVVPGGDSTLSGAEGQFELELDAGRWSLEARQPGFEPKRLDGVRVGAGRVSEVEVAMDLEPHQSEILVTPNTGFAAPSDFSRRIDRRQLEGAHRLHQDSFKAVASLPGVATAGSQAVFGVRGSEPGDVATVVDGQEILEPYHLRDFGDLVGIVAPATVDELRLHSGPLPAEWGDRSGGVLEVTTARPEQAFQSFSDAGDEHVQMGASGVLRERGLGFFNYRTGEPDVADEIAESAERPTYWDGFGKLGFALSANHDLTLEALLSDDRFFFIRNFSAAGAEPEPEQFITDHEISHLWLRHNAILGARYLLESTAHHSRIDRNRFGASQAFLDEAPLPDRAIPKYAISDNRALDRAGLRLHATRSADSGRHELRTGVEARKVKAVYNYFDLVSFFDPPVEGTPEALTFYHQTDSQHFAAFASDRVRLPGEWTLDLALRYDRPTLTDEHLWSPRLSVARAFAGGIWRGAWGFYRQPQRPNELDVPDGETAFQLAESVTLTTLGYERTWSSGVRLRADVYDRRILHPHRRYENLYKPVSRFPEIEVDRVLIEPERGRARGLEILVSRSGRRLGSRFLYVLSRSEERVDGVLRPRSSDQRHRLRFEFNFQAAPSWDLHLAWSFGSGRPTTPLEVRTTPDGGFEVVPGAHQAERLPSHHQLDLRVAREWSLGRFQLRLDLGLDNLYDRRLVRGFDTDFTVLRRPGGELEATASPELGQGLTPRWSLRVRF